MAKKSFDSQISPAIEAILRDEFETLLKDPNLIPQEFPDMIKASQEHLNMLVREYRKGLEAMCQAQMQKGLHRTRTVEERIKEQIRFEQPHLDPKELEKPLGELSPLLKRFDWRSSNVLPEIRKQKPSACWAAVATQAFESSLGIQLSNFSISGDPSAPTIFFVAPVILNQNSALNHVSPFHKPKGGRYERAFNHYFKNGIPLDEIVIDSTGRPVERDAPLHSKHTKRPKQTNVAKAIGWNYVNAKPWITPTPANQTEFEAIKRALLEHGPLAVSVAATEEFFNYGGPVKKSNKSRGKMNFKNGVQLRFPANTPVRFDNIQEGNYTLRVSIPDNFFAHSSRGAIGQDHGGKDSVLLFLANTAPKLEPNTKAIFNPLSCGGDDAVSVGLGGTWEFRFTAHNGVGFEKDKRTGEMILRFPTNTDAEFAQTPTGDLIARFPADTAPVFDTNTGDSLNHVILLIGWDDEKEAWIIQNASGTDWGYQCNGPNVRNDQAGSENRGYMYIRYGCNNIGQFAAWIEAPLLDRALMETWG